MKSDREGIENKLWKIRELEGGKPITLVLYNRFDKVTSDQRPTGFPFSFTDDYSWHHGSLSDLNCQMMTHHCAFYLPRLSITSIS